MTGFTGSGFWPARFGFGRRTLAFLKDISLVTAAALMLGPFAAQAGDSTPAAPEAPAAAEQPAADKDAKTADPSILKVPILMAREIREDRLPPLSLLDIPPPDDGVAGARLAIADNNTTGRFLNQEFVLEVVQSAVAKDLVDEVVARVNAGTGFVVVDASPDTLLALSDALKDKDAVLFNASAPDEILREEQCRVNIKHTAPSRSMLTDGLAQYIAWKQWRNWVMVIGPAPEDKLYAEAMRRSAKRFGHKIIAEKTFDYDPGSRRSDGGFEQIQQQIPGFMQDLPDHDVVVVADEGELFGDYFPYRTWSARPVIGTSGLFATSWHPAVELWGGTQFQNRFKRLAARQMRPLDYNVWTAVRSIGEAATRKGTADAKTLIDYMRSPEFELAAFKGQKLTYRAWNGQLRQPILVATGKIHVTVSPQQGFLHQFTELDTLGVDQPESKCTAFKK